MLGAQAGDRLVDAILDDVQLAAAVQQARLAEGDGRQRQVSCRPAALPLCAPALTAVTGSARWKCRGGYSQPHLLALKVEALPTAALPRHLAQAARLQVTLAHRIATLSGSMGVVLDAPVAHCSAPTRCPPAIGRSMRCVPRTSSSVAWVRPTM